MGESGECVDAIPWVRKCVAGAAFIGSTFISCACEWVWGCDRVGASGECVGVIVWVGMGVCGWGSLDCWYVYMYMCVVSICEWLWLCACDCVGMCVIAWVSGECVGVIAWVRKGVCGWSGLDWKVCSCFVPVSGCVGVIAWVRVGVCGSDCVGEEECVGGVALIEYGCGGSGLCG